MADIYGDQNPENLVDTINGTSDNDNIYGLEAGDYLSGGAGDDNLYGGAGDDSLYLYAATGSDTLYGGTGDDRYYVYANATLVEEDDQGTDTVYTTLNYTLGDNFENLVLGIFYEATDINGTGNTLDNEITGNIGDNIIYGLAGDDFIDGNGGNDTLYGGAGDDMVYGGGGQVIDGAMVGGSVVYGDDTDAETEDGNDLVGGGAGDTLYGGGGDDEIGLAANTIIITADEFDPNVHTVETIASHQEIYGGDGNDLIQTDSARNDYSFNGQGYSVVNSGLSTLIEGGAGNDHITFGHRTDLIFQENFGHDVFGSPSNMTTTLAEYAEYIDGSTIQFTFARPDDLSLQRMGDDLFIVTNQGTLRVTDYFGLIDATSNTSPYTISFDNGTDVLAVADIQQAVLNGGDGDDAIIFSPAASDGSTVVINGGAGSDYISIGSVSSASPPAISAVIDGGAGNDVYSLYNTGSTTLMFSRDSGRDFIYDGHTPSQLPYSNLTIAVQGDVDLSELAFTYQDGRFALGISGSDAALVIDAATATTILEGLVTWNVDLGSMSVSVQDLLLAMPEIQSGALVLGGNANYDGASNSQNETVIVYSSDVVSGTDNETFQGFINTATFNSGFGQDTLVGSTQQIVFADDVSNFTFSRNGNDITIESTTSADSLLIKDYFLLQTAAMRQAGNGNSNLTFNGIPLSGLDFIDKFTVNNTASVIQLDAGETYVSNTSAPADADPQTFYADLGATTINGGAGENTIYYGTETTVIHDTALGGNDVVKATTSGSTGNVVIIKVADLNDLTMSFQGEDVLITNPTTGSTLFIDESYMVRIGVDDGINPVYFFGDSGDMAAVAAVLIPGYTNEHTHAPSYGNLLIEGQVTELGETIDETLHAYDNKGLAEWVELDGKGGDDTYIGGVSSDIFDYYTGSTLTIRGATNSPAAPVGYDIVDMSTHASVNSTALTSSAFTREGNDLFFSDGTGGTLTIEDFFLTQSLEAAFEETVPSFMLGEASFINLDSSFLQAGGADVFSQLGSGIYDTNYSPFSTSHVVDAIQFSDRTVSYAEIAALFPDEPGAGDDTIYGTDNPDELHGLGGNDTIYGHSQGNEAGDALNGALDGDTLYGEDGDDALYGANGGDTLDGGSGSNTLVGGVGDDTYLVSSDTDVLVENAGEGHDQVISSVSMALSDNVEDLMLTGSDDLTGTGNAEDNLITGNSGSNVLDGGTGGDVLFGSEGDDTLLGGEGDDTLYGGDGYDVLQGDAGTNTLVGGAGDDIYLVSNSGDATVESAGEGYDQVISSATHTLGDHVEDLILTGSDNLNGTGNAQDNILIGNDGDNVLDGGAGSDVLLGGSGNDTYLVSDSSDAIVEDVDAGQDEVQSAADYSLGDNIENLTLTGTASAGTGNALDNILTGNAVNNVLDGGAGADTMIGGTGDDTYHVDNAGDVITENISEGTDLVNAAFSYTLGDNVENLTLTGTAISGTGNASANTITGNAEDNLLDGAAGADTLVGGAGNDTYLVDNAGDVVTENSGEGTDQVTASVSYVLGAEVENLTLTGTATNGTGNASINTITGNELNNVLDGGIGADTLIGGTGDDTYHVDNAGDVVTENSNEGTDLVNAAFSYTLGDNVENLTLTGTAISGTGNDLDNIINGNGSGNTLAGGAGNDVLDGKGGADTLTGGTGNDTYYVDNINDSVVENDGEGTDTVYASVSYTNLGAYVENLTLTGVALNGTGNAQDNTITGTSAINVLDGGAGADTLIGGNGNDTYVVDNIGDTVVETTTGGTSDLVNSSITYTLASNVERLTLTGTANIDGTGNTGNNTLTGNSGNNVLNGLGGTDTLVGGAGDDTYYHQAGVTITENTGQGTDDTVITSVSGYILGSNLEHLILAGTTASATGNAADNTMTGNGASNTLNGNGGHDILRGGLNGDNLLGGSGNDILMGEAGNGDNLQGGSGNDIYVLNRGDGSDIITEADATPGNMDTAQFGSSGTAINHDQLWFKRVGNNLEVSVIGSSTSDKFTITGWYQNPSPDATINSLRDVEQFEASDGYTLTDAQVQNLVNAMASFAPPAAGTTTLDPGAYGAVLDQIAASWTA